MQQSKLETLRPNAVVTHVERIARRMGCNDVQAMESGKHAVKSLRAGDTAHRAICSGVRLAAEYTGNPILPLPPQAAPSRAAMGFTLIELMIVVAIIAILAAIALPAYQDYVIRGQVSEGLVLASGAKTAVTDSYSNNGAWPIDNAGAGLATSGSIIGKYVTGVDVSAPPGTITVTFGGLVNAAVAGSTLVLSAVAPADAGSVAWTCKSTTIAPKFLPADCR